jgi:hypothetical protein
MSWSGKATVEWMSDGRSVKLLNELSFNDGKRVWVAPKDSIVDGASIPWFFWRFIGSPFVGKYRRASVIHDVYCVTEEFDSKEVHKVFYKMMVADEVRPFKASFMWLAVRLFGPRFRGK